jgi:hypothetical protein
MLGSEYARIKSQGLQGVLYEPVSEWLRWARWFGAAVQIAIALASGRPASFAQWKVLGYGEVIGNSKDDPWWSDFQRNTTKQRDRITGFVQSRFLQWSGVIPVVGWSGEQVRYTLGYQGEDLYSINQRGARLIWPQNSLYPALVAHLLAVISSGHRVFACEDCGRLHERQRRPQIGAKVRCSLCGSAARREGKNESARRRRREGRQT